MPNITNTDIIETLYKKITKTNIDILTPEIYKKIEEYYQEGEIGQEILLNILIDRRIKQHKNIVLLDGLIFHYLMQSKITKITTILYKNFPKGIVPLNSSLLLNYQELQNLLMNKKFKEADILTKKSLCELAGLNINNKRNWLYFTDVPKIPQEDLFMIDFLWQIYSYGKFGFSIQRKIWISNHYNWNKLWQDIGWMKGGIMRRYPQEFIWNVNAPIGHLPLFNQLRGNQVLSSLFEHTVWTQSRQIK